MARKTKEVRRQDIRQGKTIWLVDLVIADGMPDETRRSFMARYPHKPQRWANDDAWGRARLKQPRRIFIHDRQFHLEALSILFETSKAFYRRRDAQAYYNLIAPLIISKKALLEARFPADINPPKHWIGGMGHFVEVARVPIDLSMDGPINAALANGLTHKP